MKNNSGKTNSTPVRIADSGLPAPVISYLGDRGVWRLDQPYSVTVDDHHIRIPAGFEFDLASVPRPLWCLIAPFELSIAAPLVHDFLYQNAGELPEGAVEPYVTYTRAEADRLFLELMRREGVPVCRRLLAYAAVRLFGSFAWGA